MSKTQLRPIANAYSGATLGFPFRANSRGELVTVSDRSQIVAQTIADIIETVKEERVMLPDYGLSDHVFGVVNSTFAARVAYEIEVQVRRYEPLCASIRARGGVIDPGTKRFVPAAAVEAHRAVLSVEFQVVGESAIRTLTYPLWQYSEVVNG